MPSHQPLDNLAAVHVCSVCVCRAHAQWCKAQLFVPVWVSVVCCLALPCYPVCDAYFIGGETPAWGDRFRTHALINPGQLPAFHTSINAESHTLHRLSKFGAFASHGCLHNRLVNENMYYCTSVVACACCLWVPRRVEGWENVSQQSHRSNMSPVSLNSPSQVPSHPEAYVWA